MKYLSRAEVQRRYGGIGRSTTYRWPKNPKIGFPEPVKIGHRVLWREEDLDAFDQRIAAD